MSLVDSFTHLKGLAKSDTALLLLQRIASLVKPVMRKHDWKLPVLAEIFPDEPNLLGLNMNNGQKILLRLRPSWAPDTLYDEEQLVAVMLHELTHNVHSAHDEKFYKFLSELEAEYDALRFSGYDGEGFHSAGKRLGVGVSHDLPPHLARAKALQAAEKRKAVQNLMGNPNGQRLGGRSLGGLSSMSPRELAVQAAERRARDDKSCGTRRMSDAQREADKAARESIEDKADVNGNASYTSASSFADGVCDPITPAAGVKHLGNQGRSSNLEWSCSVCTLDNLPSSLQCEACSSPRSNRAAKPSTAVPASNYGRLQGSRSLQAVSKHDEPMAGWNCSVCTLLNPGHFLQCSVCSTARPERTLKDGWTCLACGEEGMAHDFWSCRSCGRIKDSSASE